MRLGAFAGAAVLTLFLLGGVADGAAASKGLRLRTENQGVLAPGVEAFLEVALLGSESSNCDIQVGGTLVSNEMRKDELAYSEAEEGECVGSPAATVSPGSWQMTLSASGKAKLIASTPTTITEAGPCIYLFSKVKSTIPIPGELSFVATSATGKLDKPLSSRSCPTKSTREILWSALASEPERTNPRIIETELTG
jgi:hypothetical protein